MDVEVKGRPGTWMIVEVIEPLRVRVVSVDAPGDVASVTFMECRELWPAGAAS
jgi:hypothetical protein